MSLIFHNDSEKIIVFQKVIEHINSLGFNIVEKDETRPWGGFLVIDESQTKQFTSEFFSSVKSEDLLQDNRLSPKILIVAPHKKLSWQYHFRRSELWRIVSDEVAVAISDNDKENEAKKYNAGEIIKLKKGERHRLIGLSTWGVVAEIWQHSDKENPSNEEDIVRLQDDYGR